MHNGNKNTHKMIYLDHNATTPLAKGLSNEISTWLESWGNPSSIHWASRGPKAILRNTRRSLAEYFHVDPIELVFTSGASESNNTIIKAVFEHSKKNHRNHFICSSVEHPSVLQTMKYLELNGAQIDFIPVSKEGLLDLDYLRSKISEKTALVSVMLANNETGNIFPIQQIAKLAHNSGALMHTDAVQGFGKMDINLQELGVDYASFSAHKFYALKGCGVMYIKRNAPFQNLIHGGRQERSRRGGTENILAIASLGYVTNQLKHVYLMENKLSGLRNEMEEMILQEIPYVRITGRQSSRLCNTSSMVIQEVEGETLLMALDLCGYAVSTGAACSSGNPEPSPTLMAMGLQREEAQSSLRVSLGWETTREEIHSFVQELKKVVLHLRNIKLQEVEHNL